MLAAAAAAESGKGVLFIVKNYAGDCMNFEMASEMLDLPNATVLVNDDVAVENSTHTTGRRGVAGTLIVIFNSARLVRKGEELEHFHPEAIADKHDHGSPRKPAGELTPKLA